MQYKNELIILSIVILSCITIWLVSKSGDIIDTMVEEQQTAAEITVSMAQLETSAVETEPETTILETETESEIEETTPEPTKSEEELYSEAFWNSWFPYDFLDLTYDQQYRIAELCCKYQLSYEFLIGWMWTESNCKFDCIGDNGNAIGPMQVWPLWHNEYATNLGLNLWDPYDNIEYAIILLTNTMKLERCDLMTALIRYNGGKDYPNVVFENVDYIHSQILQTL